MDILNRLKELVKPGSCEADGSVIDAMEEAIAEIERLRVLTGAANSGQSFTDIKQEIKRGQ